MVNIPKNLQHIWVGPKQPPMRWMKTWPEKHPDWKYSIFTNESLLKENFHNRKQIDYYMYRGEYHGAADLIRYELLYKYGGFIPPADACCLYNTDELWVENKDTAYLVYESEKLRPGFVSPVYAANTGNKFLESLIETLHSLTEEQMRAQYVYKVTGNQFLCEFIKKTNPKNIKIFPSHYFIPTHFSQTHVRYDGPDKVYAEQYFGTTFQNYNLGV